MDLDRFVAPFLKQRKDFTAQVLDRGNAASQTLNVTAANDRLLPSLLKSAGIIGGIGPVESGTGVTLTASAKKAGPTGVPPFDSFYLLFTIYLI